MPVEFLTDEQAQLYGRYTDPPTVEQLGRYFFLDDADQALVNQRRKDPLRLGFALQLCTVRFLGTFLGDPTQVPAEAIHYVSRQLDIADPSCLSQYLTRWSTHFQHAREIKRQYGYTDFHDPSAYFRLLRWMYGQAWLSAERPSLLFDLATAWLIERKILLPGVTTLARLVARVRDQAAARVWRQLSRLPTEEQQARLEALLGVPAGDRQSHLDRLRRSPTRVSGPALVEALNRIEEFRALGINTLDLTSIPSRRLQALARYAATAWAPTIARMPDPRRLATLVAFVHAFEIRALDDALDLLDRVITEVVAEAHRLGRNERLRTLRDLDGAALQLRQACEMLLDDTCDSVHLRAHVFARISREQIQAAVATVAALARPPDDNYYPELVERYHRVRRFLPTLLRTLAFEGTQAGQPVLEAVAFLARIEGQRKPDMNPAPLDGVSGPWRRWLHTTEGEVDRRAYTLCALERLQDSLRRRDVFVSSSERWGDPRAQLLQGDEWDSLRAQVCRTLGRQPTGRDELKELAGQLDEAFRRTATNLPMNTAVSIDHSPDRATLTLSGLDKDEESSRLLDLRQQVEARLPRIDLPGLLLEIHARTGFADEFTHISEGGTRVKDLPVSLCAVLMAEACNLGLEPVMRPDLPTLAPGRLYWVQQNYLRAETLTRVNARLVEAQSRSRLAQIWGGGEVASADGLRFVVPVRTLNAGPNRKYFHVGRGVTYYNFTSDQFTGFHGIVIPGTLRDSLYILEGLLEQETGLNPVEIRSDTAGASDTIFGLFWLLGYQFSPRLADVGEARFWRLDKNADYESLEALARQRINARLIERNWDDLLRLAGSLKLGRIRASELVRSLLSSHRPSTLARALRELGRISKTLFLLAYIDDENYRRRILIQLNRGEGRRLLARTTFHGQRGELRQRYREGQEDQLGALGLVVNVIVLWNTLYMEAALNQLRDQGTRIEEEDVARLSPLGYRHISFLGEYSFALPDAVAQGQFRPLRNPEEGEIF